MTSEWRWFCEDGRNVSPSEVIASIVSFLEQEGVAAPLSDTENRLEVAKMLKMQDFDMVLVSIEPIVVVMVREDERFVYFDNSLASFETPAPRYHQHIERGSSMPYGLELCWFSPDLGGGIRKPDFLSETKACLDFSEGSIQLEKNEETWVARRVESCRINFGAGPPQKLHPTDREGQSGPKRTTDDPEKGGRSPGR